MKSILLARIVMTLLWAATLPASMNAAETANAGDIARAVSKDVGTIGKTSPGTKGSPIIILEEMHTSRAGQIELAIALTRLHDQFQLRDLALEGYLKERASIDNGWYVKAGRGLTAFDRASVAAQLLREGEISAAEFMKLSYEDITLHPIETLAEHGVELGDAAATASVQYLFKIAELSLKESHVPRLQSLQQEFTAASGEQKNAKAKDLMDFILSVDPWVAAKSKSLTDNTNSMRNITSETMLADIEEIDRRAKQVGASLEEEDRRAMEDSLKFWRGRVAASKTMVDNAGRVADGTGVKIVALNVGAAHTDGMAAMLAKQSRPFAVIRPLALNSPNQANDMGMDAFDRKQKRMSVFTEGFTAELIKTFQKKPEPVVNQSWFRAKGELYLFTRRITTKVLGGGGQQPPGQPPSGGSVPPFRFSDDDFRGEFVLINPKDISIIPDSDDPKGGKAVLFKAVLNPSNPTRRKDMWVKAGLVTPFSNANPDAQASSEERQSVEEMLKQHLEEVRKEAAGSQSEQEVRLKKAEDAAGRVQIGRETLAAFSLVKEGLKKVRVTSVSGV